MPRTKVVPPRAARWVGAARTAERRALLRKRVVAMVGVAFRMGWCCRVERTVRFNGRERKRGKHPREQQQQKCRCEAPPKLQTSYPTSSALGSVSIPKDRSNYIDEATLASQETILDRQEKEIASEEETKNVASCLVCPTSQLHARNEPIILLEKLSRIAFEHSRPPVYKRI